MTIFTFSFTAACDFLYYFFFQTSFNKLSEMVKHTLYMFSLQDYGKESQAKDVIEEYFKSKK